MQKIIINQVEYFVPVSWDEVKYKDAIKVLNSVDDKANQLSILSKIPIEYIDKFTDLQAQKLFNLISFTENLEIFENNIPKDKYKDFDYGSIEYGDAEACRNIMINSESGFEAVISIINKLTGDDISNEPVMDVIGTANFFLYNSIVSMIATPNLMKLNKAMNILRQDSEDYKILAAFLHTSNSQNQELSEVK